MIRSVEQQVRRVIQDNRSLDARATLLHSISVTLAALGLFSIVLSVGLTKDPIHLVAAGMPLVMAAGTAAWARSIKRRLRHNERRIETIVSTFNEQTGYPESAFVVRNLAAAP